MNATRLKTNAGLLQALKVAGQRPISEAEIRAQRVSFIVGSIGDKNSSTRAHIQEVLDKQEGRVPA